MWALRLFHIMDPNWNTTFPDTSVPSSQDYHHFPNSRYPYLHSEGYSVLFSTEHNNLEKWFDNLLICFNLYLLRRQHLLLYCSLLLITDMQEHFSINQRKKVIFFSCSFSQFDALTNEDRGKVTSCPKSLECSARKTQDRQNPPISE